MRTTRQKLEAADAASRPEAAVADRAFFAVADFLLARSPLAARIAEFLGFLVPAPPAQPSGVTHVLAYMPPYLVRRRDRHLVPEGAWHLQDVAGFDACEPPPGGEWTLDAPRDTPMAVLATWAECLLGCPVRLGALELEVRPGRLPLALLRQWRPEPAYEVVPL